MNFSTTLYLLQPSPLRHASRTLYTLGKYNLTFATLALRSWAIADLVNPSQHEPGSWWWCQALCPQDNGEWLQSMRKGAHAPLSKPPLQSSEKLSNKRNFKEVFSRGKGCRGWTKTFCGLVETKDIHINELSAWCGFVEVTQRIACRPIKQRSPVVCLKPDDWNPLVPVQSGAAVGQSPILFYMAG